jgi:NADPH2:quinone reductase
MILFGQASGPVPATDLAVFGAKGSLFFQRPSLMHYTEQRADLLATANDLIDVVGRGIVKIETHQRFALRDAPAAHKALEGRQTTGSTVLIP